VAYEEKTTEEQTELSSEQVTLISLVVSAPGCCTENNEESRACSDTTGERTSIFRRGTILTVHLDVSSLVHALRDRPVLEKEHCLPAFRFNKSFLHSAGRKGIPEPAERRYMRPGTRNT